MARFRCVYASSLLLLCSAWGCDETPYDPPERVAAHEYSEYDEYGDGGESSESGAYDEDPAANTFAGDTAVASDGPPPQRYVAMMPMMSAGDACPRVPQWSHRPLFHLTASARTAWGAWTEDGGQLPPLLARFCVYTTEDPVSAPPDVPGAVRVDPDLAVVVPQAGPPPSVPQARAEHLLAELGAVPSGLAPSGSNPYSGDPNGLPYVAVIDTADSTPPGFAVPPSNPTTWPAAQRHGLTMAALIDATRCPASQANCLARQYRAQAFPFASAQAQPEPVLSGGQWASLGSLAAALGEAIIGWRSRPDSGLAPLVLNLSVGWDPAHGTIPFNHDALLDPSHPDPSVPATVQAVHSALAWASCQGVVSVAASGNTRGAGCSETGPLAPASWESLPPVSASRCAAIAGAFASTTQVPALTHGAGGALDSNAPIGNARLRSLPSRVFYAHQGAVSVGGGVSETLTGSSLAAASFSSLIATTQTYLPALSETEVINTIDLFGAPSSIDTDWLQPGVTVVRQFSFHDVFRGAVGPSSPYHASGGDRIEDAIANEIFTHPQMSSNPDLVELSPDLSTPTGCGPIVITAAADPNANGIPDATAATDELRPQPHVPICPTCPVLNNSLRVGARTPSFSLYLRIDPAYDPADISQATLSFVDRSVFAGLQITLPTNYVNTSLAVVDLTRTQLPDGTTVNDWLATHTGASTGVLNFSIDDGSGPQPLRQVIDVVR